MRVQQPQIVLLREGTDTSQGKAQLISNINACCAVVDAVRTTLVRRRAATRRPGRHGPACRPLPCDAARRAQGPLGMDKLVHDARGTTISNDGATIMKVRRRCWASQRALGLTARCAPLLRAC